MKHKSPIGLDKLHSNIYIRQQLFFQSRLYWILGGAFFDDYTTYNKTNALFRPQVHALDKSNFEVESIFSFSFTFTLFFLKKEAKDSLLFSKELHYYLFSRHISTNKKNLLISWGKKLTKKILIFFYIRL